MSRDLDALRARGGPGMMTVAVVAHARKSFGGGLGELRQVVAREGVTDPLWLAILPAGTANLLATNLEIPTDLGEAVRVGLYGRRRPLDTGSVNGEWARTLGRVALGKAEGSPFVELSRGRKLRVRFDRPLPYELDGGAHAPVTKLRIKVHPAAVRICVPPAGVG